MNDNQTVNWYRVPNQIKLQQEDMVFNKHNYVKKPKICLKGILKEKERVSDFESRFSNFSSKLTEATRLDSSIYSKSQGSEIGA